MSVSIELCVETTPFERIEADLAVAGFFLDERPLRGAAGRADWRLCGVVTELVESGRLRGKVGEATLVPSMGRLAADRVLLLGLGRRSSFRVGRARDTSHAAVERGLALERACARNLFARAAKAPLSVPADLPARVEKLLSRRCLELVGLANRAGQAVSGFERVTSRLASGGVAMLLAAVDTAEDGRRKLRAAARAQESAPQVVELFTAEELGRALGQAARAHVAIAPGGFAERLAMEAARLSGLRG